MIGQANTMADIGKVVNEVSMLELFARNNLVIPEIQREYVWGNETIGKYVLDGFFRDFLKSVQAYSAARDDLVRESDELKARVRQLLADSNYEKVKDERLSAFSDGVISDKMADDGSRLDSKVGFVYAYIPGFAKDGVKRVLTAYLIDGQQRVTTFFLMWLHLARKANKIAEFQQAVRYEHGNMAFDFKVRPLTHDFLEELVRQVIASDGFDFSSIEDATWFLSEYSHDVSVMSMVNALKVWDESWGKRGFNASLAYEYLTRHVTFWLFVMNETAQGERLYITMNGRGKNLSEDEIIRAKVFRDAVENGIPASDVGLLFESMTDFFWTHRIKSELTADKGMKKFFRWVYLLERYDAEKGMEKMQKFATALRNDGEAFELRETMFGLDEDTHVPLITFALIKDSFENLKKLCAEGSPAKKFLRDSVLDEADRGGSFQQDCFVLLPLLRWLNGLQVDPNPKEVGRFARYLRKMGTKHDVYSAPAEAVPAALKLADEFVKFTGGDFLEFLAAEATKNAKLSKMVLPDEEVAKATRLLSILNDNEKEPKQESVTLFKQFEKLIMDVEDFKSSGLCRSNYCNILRKLDDLA